MEYHTHPSAHNGQTQDTSGTAPAGSSSFSYQVGRGGLEITAGRGMTAQTGHEYSTAPTPDAVTGLTFKTTAGSPVPATGPRMTDLVIVGGMDVLVGQAIRDGLIPSPFNQGTTQRPQVALDAPQPYTAEATQNASEAVAYDASEDFSQNILPSVSPATTASLEADLMEGEFSEKTMDYFQLEAHLSAGDMGTVRDAYAAKVATATGMDEAELQDLWNGDRAGFAKAASEMLKTGSTSAFQTLAERADAASYVPLSNDEAEQAWRSPDFPQALIDAGLKPSFDGGVVSINIPNRGLVTWADAVAQGLVTVSRA
jgi:hypothetical protein